MKKIWIITAIIGLSIITGYAQDLTFNQTPVNMDSVFNTSLLVCKLSGPAFQERKAALQKEIFSKVKKREELTNGFAFHFDDNEDFLMKLMDYTLAEKKCCPFFQIDISIKPDNEGIHLALTGPDGVKAMMQDLIDN